MITKRTKKRNKLTTNQELAELAYILHLSATRLRATVTEINIPAAFRAKLDRRIQDWVKIAQSLGDELNGPNSDAFLNKESTEKICEQLGLFK